jgi:hypothetical protein
MSDGDPNERESLLFWDRESCGLTPVRLMVAAEVRE